VELESDDIVNSSHNTRRVKNEAASADLDGVRGGLGSRGGILIKDQTGAE